MKKSGFTLIELLVVIAIIAILAAILFPVFAKAREKARQTQCASNEKQIGLAILQYTQDYDEIMPFGEMTSNTIQPTSTKSPIWGCLSAQAGPLFCERYGPQAGQPYWMGYIYPYTKSSAVYYCPDGPGVQDAPYWTGGGYSVQSATTPGCAVGMLYANCPAFAFGYTENPEILLAPLLDNITYNANCQITSGTLPTLALSKIGSPDSVIMLTDYGQANRECLPLLALANGNTEYTTTNTSPGFCGASSTTPGFAYGNSPSPRHSGGSNMLYADGHVKWMVAGQYYANETNLLTSNISQ